MAGIESVFSKAAGTAATLYSAGMRGESAASEPGRGKAGNPDNRVGPAYTVELSLRAAAGGYGSEEMRRLKRTGQIECQTCKERRYQDGSDDPGVSFKAPGHISPQGSAAVVMAHEREHVGNEQAEARSEGRKVVAQSVRLFTSVCPECGKAYVSGGETRTVTAADDNRQQAGTEDIPE